MPFAGARSNQRVRWLAGALWGIFGVVLLVTAVRKPTTHSVYGVYAQAAQDWWHGHDLYSGRPEPYRYSPLFAILFTPFSLLPDGAGCALWKLTNLAAFAAALAYWARRGIANALSPCSLSLVFLLVLPGVLHSAYIGQANLLMAALCLVATTPFDDERLGRVALLVAGAVLIKVYPLALALILAVQCGARFGRSFLACLTVGLVLPLLTAPWELVSAQYASWARHLWASGVGMRERVRSLDHLFTCYGITLPPALSFSLGIVGGAAGILLVIWLSRRTAHAVDAPFTYVVFALWAALFGPATETCTYAIVTPALAWVWIEAPRPFIIATRSAALISMVLMGPAVTDAFGQTVRHFANAHGSQPLGALLLLVCVLVCAHERRRGPGVVSGYVLEARAA